MVTEQSMFVQCGMSCIEALRTATINAARILAREETIGSIAEGKHADMFLGRRTR
jgi:imidazolonepropionase-like amidohydrolase